MKVDKVKNERLNKDCMKIGYFYSLFAKEIFIQKTPELK